jgi:hypothetical protein
VLVRCGVELPLGRGPKRTVDCPQAYCIPFEPDPFFLVFLAHFVFFSAVVLMSTKAKRKEEDITGQDCTRCREGKAIVVPCTGKDRYFFGCSTSTEDKPCKGSKEWNFIQVSRSLYIARSKTNR